jgi:hypothetical protein
MVIISLFSKRTSQVNSFDIYDLPKQYLEDISESFHDEGASTIFVDDYIQKIIESLESSELHNVEELVFKFSKLASFFSRLKNETDKLYGDLLLKKFMDQADMVADGIIEDHESIPIERTNISELERVLKLFEEE